VKTPGIRRRYVEAYRVPPLGRGVAYVLLMLSMLGARSVQADAVGRKIYEDGVLGNGALLTGVRQGASIEPGEISACAHCHRPSGMGGVEGEVQTPPITGNALFGVGDRVIATMDPRTGKAFNLRHEPYTDNEVGNLVRSGRYPDGRLASAVMPRYALEPADLSALVGYLKGLSVSWSPGVTADTIRIATVITPDVAPARRAVFIDMVTRIVQQKNGSTKVAGSVTRHHMTSAAELVLGTERRWALDLWKLQGAPETWSEQLDALYAKAPVFALVSGLGGHDWGAVDAFCDRAAVPCWFPSVASPSVSPRYTLYFNAGVNLEARVLAHYWRESNPAPIRRVVQLRGTDVAATAACAALTGALSGSRIQSTVRVLPQGDHVALATAMADLTAEDAVVIWLPAEELPALADLTPPRGQIWFSGTLGVADPTVLPTPWRSVSGVIYPYELPALRTGNLSYFRAWLAQRKLPLVDETMQSEVFFAFSFFTDTIAEMLNNLHRDYLIERAEAMIDRRELARAESEYFSSTSSHVRLQEGSNTGVASESRGPVALQSLRGAGSRFLQREGTTVYPRLSLGSDQRFASKGAYLVHFGPDGQVVPESDWIVP